MRKAIIGAAVVALALPTAGGLIFPATASARSIPSSPDGIHSWSLCGTRGFNVDDGVNVHKFTSEGKNYVNGVGTDYHWNEQVWWNGWLEVGAYRFSVVC